jgi:hypothetical protein
VDRLGISSTHLLQVRYFLKKLQPSFRVEQHGGKRLLAVILGSETRLDISYDIGLGRVDTNVDDFGPHCHCCVGCQIGYGRDI